MTLRIKPEGRISPVKNIPSYMSEMKGWKTRETSLFISRNMKVYLWCSGKLSAHADRGMSLGIAFREEIDRARSKEVVARSAENQMFCVGFRNG